MNEKKLHDDDIVIIDAARTATGNFMGTLTPYTASQLGSFVIKGLFERNKNLTPDMVDLVIMGNVVSTGMGQNPARQAALFADMPETIEAYTLNMVCGSGLKSIMEGANAIKSGYSKIVIAGGMESMTNVPYLLKKARQGYRLGNGELIDGMVHDGLWDIYNNFHMGITGELVAEKYGISKNEQDEYALNSHLKALKAIDEEKFKNEIIPITIPQKRQDPINFDTDESPRRGLSIEKLTRLMPVFKGDGTVSAGNASSINDGASAVVIMKYSTAKEHGFKPLAKITGYASGGMEPKWVMLAPLKAIPNLLEKTGKTLDDFDLIELNEAFSVQSVALLRELKLDPDKVNVHGGAVALGHAIGSSGSRILTTLINAMIDRDKEAGLACLCLGGGNAVAMSIER